MKLNKSLLIMALSFFAVSGLMAKEQSKKDEVPGVAAQPASYFYTGKPYDADLGAYTFNFRNYDPELKRWTSVDPSGFPDGANNQIYAPQPFSEVDPYGLKTYTATIAKSWYYINTGSSLSSFGAANFSISIVASFTTTGVASKLASVITSLAGLTPTAGAQEQLTLISSVDGSTPQWSGGDPTGEFKSLTVSNMSFNSQSVTSYSNNPTLQPGEHFYIPDGDENETTWNEKSGGIYYPGGNPTSYENTMICRTVSLTLTLVTE